MVKELSSKEEYESAVNSAGGKVVVIDFYADWCGPCKMIAPKIQAMSTEAKFCNCAFYKIDVDNDELASVCQQHKVNCMPTFVVIKDGKEVDRLEGANESTLREKIEKQL